MRRLILALVIIAIGLTSYYYRDEVVEFFTNAKDKISQELEELGESEEKEKISRNAENEEKPQKILRNLPPKEVEIFTVGEDDITLALTKSGVSSSKTYAYVTPQISGKITDIKVEVGDSVDEGDTLIVLGDSLSTDMAEIQYQSAQSSLDLINSTKQLTQQTSQDTLNTAQVGVQLAYEAYENAVNTRNNTADLFDEQIESAYLGIETADTAYKNAKKNYNRALDSLDDLEDQLDDMEDDLDDLEDQYDDLEDELEPNDPALLELENAISQLEGAITELEGAVDMAEGQVDNAKFGRDSAKLAVDQAELGLEQLEESLYSQLDQLDFAIESSYLQYQSAVNQYESARTGTQLQELSIEGQILQANSALQSANLNLDQKKVTAPIDGIVTSISVEEGSFAGPGQVLLKIENNKRISVTTSVNEKEAQLISLGDEVTVEGESSTAKGEIVSINPTINEMSRKIDVEIELNKSSNILPGSFVQVHFEPQSENTIFVPLNSIFIDEGKKIVKVVDEKSEVKCKEIETGQIIGDYIEITSGLKGNEEIVKTITVFLEEGEKVAVVNN